MSEMDDKIAALRAKDPTAYRQLVEELGNSLYNVAYRILRDPEKAQEAVQEAFVKMIQSIDRFEGRSSIKTWLYRITVNEALQVQRRKLPQLDSPIEELLPRYGEDKIAQPLPEWAQSPEKIVADKEFHDFFMECVSELPEPLRTTYLLKDVEQLSEQEICDTLKLTKAAVKNRAHRARLLLRQKIGERYGD